MRQLIKKSVFLPCTQGLAELQTHAAKVRCSDNIPVDEVVRARQPEEVFVNCLAAKQPIETKTTKYSFHSIKIILVLYTCTISSKVSRLIKLA